MEIIDTKNICKEITGARKAKQILPETRYIHSSIAINGASIRLDMTAAQSCFLLKLAIKNSGRE